MPADSSSQWQTARLFSSVTTRQWRERRSCPSAQDVTPSLTVGGVGYRRPTGPGTPGTVSPVMVTELKEGPGVVAARDQDGASSSWQASGKSCPSALLRSTIQSEQLCEDVESLQRQVDNLQSEASLCLQFKSSQAKGNGQKKPKFLLKMQILITK